MALLTELQKFYMSEEPESMYCCQGQTVLFCLTYVFFIDCVMFVGILCRSSVSYSLSLINKFVHSLFFMSVFN